MEVNAANRVEVAQISVAAVRPNPNNPRLFRKKDPALEDLAASIREKGVLQPILVRPLNGDAAYIVIAGERRLRAAQLAGLESIPAIVRTDLNDQEALELTVVENLQREDLHPLEEAAGVAALIASGQDGAAVADRLGKSLSWVARRARLTNLSKGWRKLVADPEHPVSAWSGAHLDLVARLEPAAQQGLLKDAWRWRHHTSVVDLARHLADLTRELIRAPWGLDDASLEPKAGACLGCPKRSSCTPGLFDEEPGEGKRPGAGDRCLDPGCWDRKVALWTERRAAELREKHEGLLFVAGGHGREVPGFVERQGGAVIPEYEYTRVKKSSEGAQPALIVSGPGQGGLAWVKVARTSAGRRKAARGGGKEPTTKQLSERKETLRQRRIALAIDRIAVEVEKAEAPERDVVLRLVAVFGTPHRHDANYTVADGHPLSAIGMKLPRRHGHGGLDGFKALDQVTAEEAVASLWVAAREILVRRCRLGFNLESKAKDWPEVQRIADVAGIDAQAHLAAAAGELPEPKSWAKERGVTTTKDKAKARTKKRTRKKARSEAS